LNWGLHWNEMDGEHPEICLVADYLDNNGVVSKTLSNGNDVPDMEYVSPSHVLVKERGNKALTYGLLMS
jgi:hypothetical protein